MKPIVQSVFGYITLKTSVSGEAAQSLSELVSTAISNYISRKLENTDRTREQIAEVESEACLKFFRVFVQCGYWEFIPIPNCPQEAIDFINSKME
jgi:hypothetical protein